MKRFAAIVILLASLPACRSTPSNRFEVIDYRPDSPAQHHYEDFEESLYSVNQDGLADIILRKVTTHSQDPTQKITQIIHLQTFWKPFPGRTYANDSMINTNISYIMFRGYSGVSYEGGGFVQYRENSKKGMITGKLEGGHLQPLRKVGSNIAIFERPTIAGRFEARRDDRHVTRIINEIVQHLGPLPRIEPDRSNPDY